MSCDCLNMNVVEVCPLCLQTNIIDLKEHNKIVMRHATIEDLKQNKHVKGLLETLERLSHYDLYSSAIDRGVYKETRTAQGQLDILTDAARDKLKEWNLE